MTEYSLFRSAIFHCLDHNNLVNYEYFADGLLVINEGKVVKVGNYQTLKNQFGMDMPITHFKNSLIMPGFIDTHLHYPQYKIIGSYGATLLDWLNKYAFVEEQKFSDAEYTQQIVELFFDEILKNGTTTAMTFCTSHKQSVELFFQAAEAKNLRMIAGKVMMDRNAPPALCDTAESSYNDSQQLIEKWHNKSRLKYAVTPRFAPTSTATQLQQAALLLQQYAGNDGVLLQTHLNENPHEIKWVQELFPDSKNYFDVYDKLGLTGENSIFAHAIHSTKDELIRMADTGSKIALCPSSNLFLGSGLFDLQQIRDHKITTALATDIGGGDSFSMFAVMNQAYKISKLSDYNLDPIQAFDLITLSAAKVLNLDNYLGNFIANKEADFLVLNLRTTKLISQRLANVTDIKQILFCLMMLGDDRLIDQVYVMGKLAYQKPTQSKEL